MSEITTSNLLQKAGKLGPETTKSVTELTFEVPEGATSITLEFD